MSTLSDAAAALGVSESIVKRSAEARAKAEGVAIEDLLAAWASGGAAPSGGGGGPAATPSELAAPTAPPAPSPPSPVTPAEALTSPAAAESDAAVAAAATAVAAMPAPKEVNPKEALRYPVVVTVPTAGLRERTVASVPRWLALLFVIVPLFGLIHLAGATTNDCGEGAELAADRVTGAAINCDGTPFQGRSPIGGEVDFVALGEQVFRGEIVPAANCQGCHGAQGQGGSGPALGPVIATFSSCVDHVEWVSKGTAGFQAEGRSTYGDLAKPVGGVGIMPSFAAQLSPEQIAAAALFERVRFGGEAPDAALVDCGLAAAESGEGTGTTGAETGTTGEGTTATTAAP